MKKKYSLTFLIFLCLVGMGFGQTFNQITSLAELTDGNYLIIGDGSNEGMMVNSTISAPAIDYTNISNPGTSITSGYTSNNIFTLTVSGGDITIYHSSVGYVSWGRTGVIGNNATFYNGTIANTERWTPTVAGGLWTLANVQTSTRILQWNSGSPRFAAYTSNQVKIKLYKQASSSYSVTYNGNGNTGGLVPSDSSAYNSGDGVTVLGNTGTLTRIGYTFNGWNTAADGSGTTYVGGNTFVITANVTLFAQWTPELVDWCNLQFPNTSPQTIIHGDSFDVYARTYEPGVTEAAGAGTGIQAWIGYNTTNNNPNTAGWTWVPATFNTQAGNDDEFTAEIGSGLTPGTYYYASRFQLNGGPFRYGGTGGFWSNDSVQLVVNPDQVDFCNVDFPKTATINTGDNFNVYAQAQEPGVTDSAGQGANIEAWIGYNTVGENYEPWQATGWTWVVATYDSDFGNNDQYTAEIGASLPVGTYYYASRFRLNGSSFSYGGIQSDNIGNFWTLGDHNNGTLVVQNAPCSELFISEYVEGSSNNKYIEIYNPTNAVINLSTYELRLYANGGTIPTNTYALTGTIPAYGTIVYRNDLATIYGGASVVSTVCNFNGDDAIALLNGGSYIDIIGSIGDDPGTAWTAAGGYSTENKTLRRKSTVLGGVNVNPASGFPTMTSEWDVYNIDETDLGNHISDCQGPTPELQLVDSASTNQNCGYTINYGSQALSSNTDITFDIENVGSADLTISSLNITGDYSIVSPAAPLTLSAGNSQTVIVRFTPTANGTRTGVLTINNDDPNESSCTVNLTGVGFTPAPEIDIERNTNASIPSSSVADTGYNTVFLSTTIGSSTAPKTYYVRNEGTANLTVSSINTTNTEFSITTNPAPMTLLPGDLVAFEITFSPVSALPPTRTGTITIISNDADENPYTFGVQGTAQCSGTPITISPTSGPENTVITVNGSNFGASTSATLNGLSANPVNVISATEIEVTVPAGATTGSLIITNDLGCVSSELFTVIDTAISGCEGSSGIAPAELFISEVTDHGTGHHSYVEIFNGTGTTVNLSGYEIRVHNNGNGSASGTVPLVGSIVNGDVFVLAFGQGDATNTHATHGYDQFSSINGINDDDNIRLYNGATWVDLWGDTNGNSFTIASKDYTYRRKNSGITAPSTTWNAGDWDAFTPVDYSDIGYYDFSVGTPPSITVEPNPPSSTCDLSATISVTADEGFVGGNPLTYQWYYNAPGDSGWTAVTDGGVYSGATTSDLSISNTMGLDHYQYYCQVQEDDASCYQASTAVRLHVDVVTWDGSNWSPTVPDNGKIAIINGHYNTSIGTNNQTSFEACSLIINNATLTIADINNGGLNTYVSVVNDVTLTGSGAILVHPQGAFVQINDSGLVTADNPDNYQVNKRTALMNQWYEYTYWSSPVQNEIIAHGLADAQPNRRFGFNAQNYLDSFRELGNSNNYVSGQDDIDDNGNDWYVMSGSAVMVPGRGYASTHNATIFNSSSGCPNCHFTYTFNGLFNNGVITVPVYRNDSEMADNNWNLLGNPYPSAIDADLFLTANGLIDTNVSEATTGVTDGAIFFWSQKTPPSNGNSGNENVNFPQSDYAIINGTGQTAGGDGIMPDRYIPSGQGFFISYSNSGASVSTSGDIVTGEVVFNNAMRTTGNNTQFFKSTTTQRNRLWVNLTSDNGVFNQILVGYLDGATSGYDGMYYDAPKNMSTELVSMLYTFIDGNPSKYAIQAKASTDLNFNEVIPLGFATTIDQATLYTLSIAQLEGNFLTSNTVYLKDNLLNIYHDLSASDYNFTSQVGEFNSRFEIVFQAQQLSVDEQTLATDALSIIELADGSVKFIITDTLTIEHIEILDILGRSLYQIDANNHEVVTVLPQLQQSAYIAKVTLSSGQVLTKRAIKQH